MSDSFITNIGDAGIGQYFVIPVTEQGPKLDLLIEKYSARYDQAPTSFFLASVMILSGCC